MLLSTSERETVNETITRFAKSHEDKLHHHMNFEANQYLDNTGIMTTLERPEPLELF